MRFSIILPLRNEEALLADCVGMLLAQPCRDMEILLVDRGSRDGTDMLCQGYQAAYPDRVRLLSLPGGTPGKARNLGICQARGDYLLFTDCGSLLRPDALADLSRMVEGSGADLYLTGPAGRLLGKQLPRLFRLEHHGELLLADLDVRDLLWKRQLFDDAYLRFPEQEGYDDLRLTRKALALGRILAAAGEELYRVKSPAPEPESDRELALLDALDDILSDFRGRGVLETYVGCLTQLACRLLCDLACRVLRSRGNRESLGECFRYLERCFPEYDSVPLPDWHGQETRRLLELIRQEKWTRLSVLFLMKSLA